MFILFPKLRMRVSVFSIPSAILMLWLEGAIPFLILMLSAAVHELGHIVAIHFCGYRIRRFDILPMGALLVCPEGIPYNKEVIIALGGPFASLLCGVVSLALAFTFRSVDLLFASVINIVLAVFNLMPFKKLDGGKALFCYLLCSEKNNQNKKTAERICSAASIMATVVFVCFLACFVFASNFNLGVILLSAVLLFQLLSKS